MHGSRAIDRSCCEACCFRIASTIWNHKPYCKQNSCDYVHHILCLGGAFVSCQNYLFWQCWYNLKLDHSLSLRISLRTCSSPICMRILTQLRFRLTRSLSWHNSFYSCNGRFRKILSCVCFLLRNVTRVFHGVFVICWPARFAKGKWCDTF